MRKIAISILFFIPIVCFSQTIKQKQVDHLNDSIATGYTRTDHLRLNTTAIPFSTPDSLLLVGNSYTVGQLASVPDSDYVHRLYNYFLLTLDNQALSGSGVWYSASILNSYLFPGHTKLTSMLAGLNDLRRSGNNIKTFTKIINTYKSAFASQNISNFSAGGSSGSGGLFITRYGTWHTDYTSNTIGGRGGVNGGWTNTSGDSIKCVFTGTDIVLFLIGADGSGGVYNYADFTVYIDGSSLGTYSENNQYDGISDGVYDNKRGPMVLFFTGLSSGNHTIKVVNNGSDYLVVDGFGQLKDPQNCTPLLLWKIPYLDVTGYAVSPSSGSVATTNIANGKIDSLFATAPFTTHPVYEVNTNAFFDTTTGLSSSDHIHPNDVGHRQLFNAAIDVLPTISLGIGEGRIYYTTTGYYGNVNGTTQKFVMGEAGVSDTINLQTTTDNGASTTNNITVTGQAKIGGSNPTDAPVQIGVNSGLPKISFYRSASGTNEKIWDTYVGSNYLDNRLINDANSSAASWMKVYRSGITPNGVIFPGAITIGADVTPPTALYIKSTAPAFRLDDIAGDNSAFLSNFTDFAQLSINRNPSTGTFTNTGKTSTQISLEGSNGAGKIHFYATNTNNTVPTEWMTLLGSGNFGLGGNTSPSEKLDVTGNGKFSGNVSVADDPYDATTWNGSLNVPTKNAIRDYWEAYTINKTASPTADFSMSSHKITSLADGTSTNDAVNKGQLDAAIAPAHYKAAVNYATTTALAANTYANGTSGVGATITFNSTGTQSIDGTNIKLDSTYLIKDESTTSHNGIYKCTTAPAVGIAGVLTRRTDFDQNSDIAIGDAVAVLPGNPGTTLGGTTWIVNSSSSPTIGTDAITFVQINNTSVVANNSITNSKLAQMAAGTYKANITGSTADPTDVTRANVITDLNVLVDPGSNGIVARTSSNTTINRTITGTTNRLAVSNGDGVSGNPTLDVVSTSAATASRIVERDANANSYFNNSGEGIQVITAAAGTTTLTVASPRHTIFTGSSTQTVKLPDATTLTNGTTYRISNSSTGNVTVQNNGASTIQIVSGATTFCDFYLTDNSTSNGTWYYFYGGYAIASGKKLTVTNSMTLAGTDASLYTMPPSSQNIVGESSSHTLSNKAIDFGSNTITASSAQIAAAVNDETGTGLLVMRKNAVLDNPTIGISGTAGSSHIITVGTVPTVSQTGAGTGGSVGVALETGSTDHAGIITITTGNASVGSTGTVTLTFNSAYVTNQPVIVLTLVKGATDWGALATVRQTTQSLSAPVFTWNNSATGAAAALTANTTYKIAYMVIQK